MKQISVLIKSGAKLLFRNKGFWGFLVIFPILSLFILNLREEEMEKYGDANGALRVINQFADVDSKVIYAMEGNDYYYPIKVYDSSDSDLTDYVLEKMLDTGLVYIGRYDSGKMTEDEVLKQAQKDAFCDRVGTVLYFTPEFEQEILSGEVKDSIQIYRTAEDDRQELVEDAFNKNISLLAACGRQAQGQMDVLKEMLDGQAALRPGKTVKQVRGGADNSLNTNQKLCKQHMGYSFAFLNLSSLFCGIFIAYTVIEERNNRILQRIMMSKTSVAQYVIAKLLLSVFVSLMQTVIMAIGIFVVVKPDYGISNMDYLFMITMQGIIFNSLSLCIGVLIGNAMSANYAVFSFWSLSGLLSGLYFDISNSKGVIRNLSNLMPQYWFMKASEMFLTEDSTVYTMVLCVTAAFLLIILSAGAAGLKMKQGEQ